MARLLLGHSRDCETYIRLQGEEREAMVDKPSVPADVDARDHVKGSATGTPGLTPLDEDREASLADEGGASGATVESQDLETLRKLAQALPVAHLQPMEARDPECTWDRGAITTFVAAFSFTAAALGVFAYRRWAR
jgi:hypothetical protein